MVASYNYNYNQFHVKFWVFSNSIDENQKSLSEGSSGGPDWVKGGPEGVERSPEGYEFEGVKYSPFRMYVIF